MLLEIKPAPGKRVLKGVFVRSSVLAAFFSIALMGKTVWPSAVSADPSVNSRRLMPAEEAVFSAVAPVSSPAEGEVLGAQAVKTAQIEEMYSYEGFPEIEFELDRSPRDKRIEKLESFLESKGSPMAPYADLIVYYSDLYGVDPRLMVAIAAIESGYGKVCFRPYNAWGFYNGSNWGSWSESIKGYMEGMNGSYFSKGARTPEAIGSSYAADPNWAARIRGEMAEISL